MADLISLLMRKRAQARMQQSSSSALDDFVSLHSRRRRIKLHPRLLKVRDSRRDREPLQIPSRTIMKQHSCNRNGVL